MEKEDIFKLPPSLEKKMQEWHKQAQRELAKLDAYIAECRRDGISPKIVCGYFLEKPLNN